MSFDRKQYLFTLENRVDHLEKENFALAAYQCPFGDGSGLCGDEGGNQYCAKERMIKILKEQLKSETERLNHIEKYARRDPHIGGMYSFHPTTFKHVLKGTSLRNAIDNSINAEKQ